MDNNRRGLLKSLALSPAAFLLPDIKRAAAASSSNIPKRLIVFCTDHGTYQPEWRPRGANGGGEPSRESFAFGPLHAPLNPFKDRAVVFDGLSVQTIKYQTGPGGDAHMQSQCHLLTGAPMVDPGPAAAGDISLDQIVVKAINAAGPQTRIPSLSLERNGRSGAAVSWYGARQPVRSSGEPDAVFKTLFPTSTGPGAPASSAAQDKSVLDFVAQEMTGLVAQLPQSDRQKLQQHAQAIRDLEKRLTLPTVRSCSSESAQKAAAAYPRYGTKANTSWGGDGAEFQMPRIDAQLRNLQAALACDLTRVAVVHTGELAPDAYGYTRGAFGTSDVHDLAHKTDAGTPSSPEATALIKAFFTKQADVLATMLRYLDDIKEADGKSLLDHSLVLWIQDVGRGNHSVEHLPWMTFGSAGGAVRTGRYLNLRRNGNTIAHNAALTSIANLFGANVQTVGDKRAGTGGLADF